MDLNSGFYIWCYIYNTKEPEAFKDFIQKTFLHYHTAFNQSSNISIHHQEICHSLVKSRNQLPRHKGMGYDIDIVYCWDETLNKLYLWIQTDTSIGKIF